MYDYGFQGSKDKAIASYQKINFMEPLLRETTQAEINAYN